MSLRKPPQLTPELLDAARRSAQHSTGPRSPAGKHQSRLNALKHGERADPGNHPQVMLALGEDPAQFENLKQELMTSFGPGDSLWEKQIDDLARLYWRRDRLERAQEGMVRRALLAVKEWQERRRQEMAGAIFDDPKAIDTEMTEPSDPGVRLRMLLSFLGVVREQVKQRRFKPRQASELETLYRNQQGWRQARVCVLLRLFAKCAKPLTPHERELEELSANSAGGEQAGEPQYQEVLRLLDEEIASVEEQFRYAEKLHEEKVAIEQDACLAPAGDEWRLLLRREETLDRSIDRKIKILLSLGKRSRTANLPGPAVDEGAGPAPAGVTAREENRKMNERTGNVDENKRPVASVVVALGHLNLRRPIRRLAPRPPETACGLAHPPEPTVARKHRATVLSQKFVE